MLVDKFSEKGMVNYVAFAAVVDPKEEVGTDEYASRVILF